MPKLIFPLRVLLPVLILLTAAVPASASKGPGYQTGFDVWRAVDGDFSNWTLTSGVSRDANGALTFNAAGGQPGSDPYAAGAYYGGNYYNAGTFNFGEATSPMISAGFPFSQAIASWNAATPPGTWIEVQVRADLAGRATKWYSLGIWASDTSTINRHSVRLQGDGDGFVAVDTLILTGKKVHATAYQLKVIFFGEASTSGPTLTNASLAYSTDPSKKVELQPGDPTYWNTLITVPECSQMVYPDGGTVWCSPTSTSMVLGSWGIDSGPCEPRVRAAVDGVYDWIYDGHGNWPFNTAYAASRGMQAYVVRYPSFRYVEEWVAAGVPVVISFAWGNGDLTGAAIPSSNGHLAVVVGFDGNGDPIVNDPAAAADGDVQRTYLRAELESLWLEHSGGTSYIIFPPGHPGAPLP